MRLPNKFKPFLITLSLCCAAPLWAADAEPAAGPAKSVPWHMESAEIRAGVKVDLTAALLRMPPQVYIADLKPLELTVAPAFLAFRACRRYGGQGAFSKEGISNDEWFGTRYHYTERRMEV